jgi:hypothetical protein
MMVKEVGAFPVDPRNSQRDSSVDAKFEARDQKSSKTLMD